MVTRYYLPQPKTPPRISPKSSLNFSLNTRLGPKLYAPTLLNLKGPFNPYPEQPEAFRSQETERIGPTMLGIWRALLVDGAFKQTCEAHQTPRNTL